MALENIFSGFQKPYDVQEFLESISYNPESECKSPIMVARKKKAHCLEGAIFAAAALRHIGFEPMLLDLRAVNDDDHVIAPFKEKKQWGAVAKSNFSTLRFREPVYRTLRELVMSYFDFYFNTKGEKTLREYSLPLNLSVFDSRGWETSEDDIGYIGERLDEIRHFPLLTKAMIKSLQKVDERLMKAGLYGSVRKGLYRPR
ncbi:MAG: hypothetical protein QME12_07460 [Nanoarchaeota archaeon]|nr:hypothetical protein [Nanoarchaeota archaeon]